MGVKVTFLREEAGGRGPGRPARWRSCPRAPSAPRTAPASCSSCSRTAVERRAVQTGGTDGDRLEVTGGPVSRANASSCRRRPTLADGTPIVIKQ